MAKLRQALMICAATVVLGASATAAAAAEPSATSAKGDVAHLRGSARVLFPPSPDDEVIFTVDAHARFAPGPPSPDPAQSWGTARLSHLFTGEQPGFIWYEIAVDCLITGGRTATVTGVVTKAAPDGQALLGRRLGFSVADLGHRDQVGMARATQPGEPELTRCMAPATFFTLKSGDFTVRDADHWQLPSADSPQGSARVPLGL
jgi:hypothetical protein